MILRLIDFQKKVHFDLSILIAIWIYIFIFFFRIEVVNSCLSPDRWETCKVKHSLSSIQLPIQHKKCCIQHPVMFSIFGGYVKAISLLWASLGSCLEGSLGSIFRHWLLNVFLGCCTCIDVDRACQCYNWWHYIKSWF